MVSSIATSVTTLVPLLLVGLGLVVLVVATTISQLLFSQTNPFCASLNRANSLMVVVAERRRVLAYPQLTDQK